MKSVRKGGADSSRPGGAAERRRGQPRRCAGGARTTGYGGCSRSWSRGGRLGVPEFSVGPPRPPCGMSVFSAGLPQPR